MSTVTIYGASDDLVEVEGIEGADEFNCDGHWKGVIESPDGGTALVYVDYRDNGTWTVTLGQYEEGWHLPFAITLGTAMGMCSYSTVAQIEVPEGSKISEVVS